MEVSLGVFVIVRKPFGNRYTPNRAGAAARVRGEVMHQAIVCSSNNVQHFVNLGTLGYFWQGPQEVFGPPC